MSASRCVRTCRKEYITVSEPALRCYISVACNHKILSYYALYNMVKVTDYSELLNLSIHFSS